LLLHSLASTTWPVRLTILDKSPVRIIPTLPLLLQLDSKWNSGQTKTQVVYIRHWKQMRVLVLPWRHFVV